jgi:hypothetical protein
VFDIEDFLEGMNSVSVNVRYIKLHRYDQKYLYPKLHGYEGNGKVSFKEWKFLHIYLLINTY